MKSELIKQRAYRLNELIEAAHEYKHCDHDKPHKYILYTFDECSRCYDLCQELEDLYLNAGFFYKMSYYLTNVPLELYYWIADKMPWTKEHACEDDLPPDTPRRDIG